jgi:hypothetical protein
MLRLKEGDIIQADGKYCQRPQGQDCQQQSQAFIFKQGTHDRR